MTIREFYAAVGGDGEKMIHRFDGEERVRKYLAFMLNDPTFSGAVRRICGGGL